MRADIHGAVFARLRHRRIARIDEAGVLATHLAGIRLRQPWFVSVPPGSTSVGAPTGHPDVSVNGWTDPVEETGHSGFLVSRFEVTQSHSLRLMEFHPSFATGHRSAARSAPGLAGEARPKVAVRGPMGERLPRGTHAARLLR
jgi:hypothetical protein